MKQKIVSFEVATAIKKAGYDEICDYGYCVVDGIPSLVKTEEEWERHPIDNSNLSDFLVCTGQEDEGKDDCTAPTYFDVWVWLWREKKIHIDINNAGYCEGTVIAYNDYSTEVFRRDNPEEAIIAAIDRLVDNDLIK